MRLQNDLKVTEDYTYQELMEQKEAKKQFRLRAEGIQRRRIL